MEIQKEIENLAIYAYIKERLPDITLIEKKRGSRIWRADQDTDTLFYIISGTVKIENVSYNEKKIIVDIVPQDNFTGPISAYHDADFLCSGIAEETTKLFILPKSLMHELMKNDGFSTLFYRKTSFRVYAMYKRILAKTLFGQEEIVAHYLLEQTKNDLFYYKSIYSMCEELGISRRGLYNILYRFADAGYIRKEDKNHIRITDVDGLTKIASKVMAFMMSEY